MLAGRQARQDAGRAPRTVRPRSEQPPIFRSVCSLNLLERQARHHQRAIYSMYPPIDSADHCCHLLTGLGQPVPADRRLPVRGKGESALFQVNALAVLSSSNSYARSKRFRRCAWQPASPRSECPEFGPEGDYFWGMSAWQPALTTVKDPCGRAVDQELFSISLLLYKRA